MFVKETRDNYQMLNWLDKYMIGHKGFICGGCFKNIFNGEKAKDLDIFFESEKDFKEAVNYYDSNTAGYWLDNDEILSEDSAKYRFLYENKNVKAYIHKETGVRIELCSKIFGTPEHVLNKFDFTITKFAYYKAEVEDESGAEVEKPLLYTDEIDIKTHIEYRVLIHNEFFKHLHLKRLVTDNEIPFPMSTFERLLRYAKYGYFPCKETKMKIARAIQGLSSEQVQVSESLYKGMD